MACAIDLKAPPWICPYRYVGRHGLNRPKSVQREALVDPGRFSVRQRSRSLEIDLESDESDGNGVHTGDGELPSLQKTKRLYTLRQK